MHGESGFGLIAMSLQRGHSFMQNFKDRTMMSAERELSMVRNMGPGFDELCRTAKASAEAYAEASAARSKSFDKLRASGRRLVTAGERNNEEKAVSLGMEL